VSWTIQKIRKALGGKLIGTTFMSAQVCLAILLLPPSIIEKVCKSVWFISSPDDSWAFTFKGSDIKNSHLIFLSDDLLSQNEEQIRYTIIHEIGHVILNHSNSIGILQTETEIKKQEREADAFARKYTDSQNPY